jgi:hypothetical protein
VTHNPSPSDAQCDMIHTEGRVEIDITQIEFLRAPDQDHESTNDSDELPTAIIFEKALNMMNFPR